MRRSPCAASGFSLIELIMVIITVGIISVVIAPVFISGFNAYFWTRGAVDVTAQGEFAMDRMAREIRGIQPSDITSFSANSLTYNLSGTPVSYSVNVQGQLMRNADLLASGVSSLTFSYFQSDWTPATLAAQIWSIGFTLRLSGDQVTE